MVEVETQVFVTESVGKRDIKVTVRDPDYIKPLRVEIGCHDEYFTVEELVAIRRTLDRAIREYKKMAK